MVENIVEQIITPVMPKVLPSEQINVYVPTANSNTPGLAKFYTEHFTIVNGVVKIRPDYVKRVLAENFQTKYDESLATEDKEIVGAINEVLHTTEESVKVLNNNIEDSLDKSIKYIRYYAEDAKLVPSKVETVPSPNETFLINGVEERFNKDDEYKGDFGVDGMSDWIDNDDNESFFFTIRRQIKPSQYGGEVGFKIELEEVTPVEIMQMFIWGIYQSLDLKISTSTDGLTWKDTTVHFDAQAGNYLNIYRAKLNAECKYIKVVQTGDGWANYRYIVKGIELYTSTTNGYYDILQRNGVKSSIDTFNATYLKERVDTGLNDIEGAAEIVNNFLKTIDLPGGFPQLNKNGKLPDSVIPSIGINDVINITLTDDVTENDVNDYLITYTRNNTLQIGDRIQFVKEESVPSVDSGFITKTVAVRTYIYSNYLPFDGSWTDEFILSNWIVTGANYAVYSDHSNTSKDAENTAKVDNVLVRIGDINRYKSLDVKNGVYIVTDYVESES